MYGHLENIGKYNFFKATVIAFAVTLMEMFRETSSMETNLFAFLLTLKRFSIGTYLFTGGTNFRDTTIPSELVRLIIASIVPFHGRSR